MFSVTIYPSGLCLVMEILRGFGSEISDRDAQSPRTSRDIVLCHPQALQEGGESIFEVETREYRCSLGGLANGSICAGIKPSRARDRTTWLSINTLHGGLLSPAWGWWKESILCRCRFRALCRKY